ncbi:MAG: dihydrolipoyl dehydrogenase [Opitutae bacterium]|jgi:dihydrolipoamide dehydrogenase|nr:dihydrolipoyl dehydrogenase [Verrucomicrobiota bacterium]MDA1077897.1 dihydrolipoyl dehydrogenase [Verrucomicrobiota bacterium]NDG99867.1 dihydrolipoyl dehydrogenase [Opitutae bacterium]
MKIYPTTGTLMNLEKPYDLIVIGGGPAGYAAGIRAGQLGHRALVIEKERAGGTCLNWGCIPSKALLKSAEAYQAALHSETFGFTCKEIEVDFAQVMARSRSVADQMGGGIEFLFKKNKVDYVVGSAKLIEPGLVEVTDGDHAGSSIKGDRVMIATGCKPRTLEEVPVDGSRIMTSREALAMKEMPASIAILGAGAIGAEFAYFLNAFGCKVTLIEMLPNVLPVEDAEISKALGKAFVKQGIDCRTNTRVDQIEVVDDGVTLALHSEKGDEAIQVESVLLAIGVVPNLQGVLADTCKVELSRGYVQVDETYQTSLPGVYAAGDIIGPPWLAHVATYRAVQAVNGMFGHADPIPMSAFPGCTYCQPQVASIGVTEEKAKEEGIAYKIGKFPFAASGKAVAVNHPEGFVKIIVGEKYGEILGAHIIGSDATELITEYGLGMKLEATVDEIHQTIHAHPTMSEALAEAAASVHGEAIHI